MEEKQQQWHIQNHLSIPFWWVKVAGLLKMILKVTFLVHNNKHVDFLFLLSLINFPIWIQIDCQKGKPYNTTLKISGCNDEEFTCDDGQCIRIGKVSG